MCTLQIEARYNWFYLGYPLPEIVWETPNGMNLNETFLASAVDSDQYQIYASTFSVTTAIGTSLSEVKLLIRKVLLLSSLKQRIKVPNSHF